MDITGRVRFCHGIAGGAYECGKSLRVLRGDKNTWKISIESLIRIRKRWTEM
ncbi:hypothetical protein MYP_380 [Sporocytophaga myxococcoides]|uniref:Uncharacterized protein n=1 Tax=Sporocytophaga myxococcoides TaxID=153721 RepID=A0A098L9S2_9BACT|nr:hypothetical protein MYP_380 [Sporocytophaga myxococcoides]